ncbi:RPA-related protein RADX-like [Manis pentadactyla]|uniref:RPA-related protein RADX-like n=1 Tax=Manis pentadactyla TaxID=143292 RepID=UPI00255D06FD|nr:RPA-related protein RADX-like [Manis pentadactyla]
MLFLLPLPWQSRGHQNRGPATSLFSRPGWGAIVALARGCLLSRFELGKLALGSEEGSQWPDDPSGELGQPEASPTHARLDRPNRERSGANVPGGVIRRAVAQGPKSWIRNVLEQRTDSPPQWITPSEVVPVAVLAVQRYLLEDEPSDGIPKPPLYCFDVTISDGVYQQCYLVPSLNDLVYKNILKVGIEMRISRVSCLDNERRTGQGILCIDSVHCGKTLDTISLETPFRNSVHEEIQKRP